MSDVTLVADRVFCVSDSRGDVDTDAHPDHGLYASDTRHLSRWTLTLDGEPPVALSTRCGDAWSRHVLVPAVGKDDTPAFTVHRDRCVDPSGLVDEITLVAHRTDRLTVDVRVQIAADFADLFEVRSWVTPRQRDVCVDNVDGGFRLGYSRGPFAAGVTVAAHLAGSPRADAGALTWRVDLAPGERWHTRLAARVDADGAPAPASAPSFDEVRQSAERVTTSFVASAPRPRADWPGLHGVWERSLRDLALLRIHPPDRPDLHVPAAGVPWYGTLFGRDSLLTAWYALPYVPALAADTLRALAALQGVQVSPDREEEPGKVLHELRAGELTVCGDLPLGRYYGTVDATPLFCCLLGAYHHRTGDDALVRELEPHVRAALAWMGGHGDLDGDGYLEYASHNPAGLVNHCWKDSDDSMRHADGSLARGPIAVCEAQGYAYDAYRRTARLARDVWHDEPLADDLDAKADGLRRRFAEDFWMPARSFPALALDGDKRQVGSVTSNAGHLLFSGILTDEHADAVAHRLLADDMFSGWGLRTMSDREPAYHPLSYHNGTVWPHDTALAVAGLARYGHHGAATTLAEVLVEAAVAFDDRLPEVFAGYPRQQTDVPVRYPTACSPQAWAAATPLLLVTALLGPDGPVDPVPPGLRRLRVEPELGDDTGSA